MDSFLVDGQGLVVDVTNSPTRARELATEWLVAHGVDEWDATEATEGVLVVRAWWGGDDVGFVQRHHDNAQAVVVVNLPVDLLTSVVRKNAVLTKDRPNPFTAESGDTDKVPHPRPTTRLGDDGRIQLGPSVA